jgi:cobalt-zinc-cadmium efflux system membrane fusion protein
MRDRLNNLRPLSCIVGVIFQISLNGGCRPASHTAKADPPAKVAKIANEEQLNTIVLTPDAEKRLGIVIAPVEVKPVTRVRSIGGEIVLPPGASLVISAPVGGKLGSPNSAAAPTAGMLVTAKQPIFTLMPMLSPERDVLTPSERINVAQAKNAIATSRIDAAGQVEQAQVQASAARIALERAQRLLRDSAGTARAVDDAQAQMSLATKALEAAESRKKLVDSISLDGDGGAGKQTLLVIESPQAGMIRSQSAAIGEVVSAGAPLFEVTQFDPIWVRLPVYAGETSDLALNEPAAVLPLSADHRARSFTAKPIAAPPTATLLAATVDLYYELANPEAQFRPGQRVTVRVKQQGSGEGHVVPWSAVVHDIHGGTWVYEQTAPHTYVRRRVQVRHVVDELAVLQSGPPPGAKIVTTAVVELFGTEFGFAK